MNKFKVGDRVKVYDGLYPKPGKILRILENRELVSVDIDKKHFDGSSMFFIKQCRLLKKKHKEDETDYLMKSLANAEKIKQGIEETETLIESHRKEDKYLKMIQDLTSTCTTMIERIEKVEKESAYNKACIGDLEEESEALQTAAVCHEKLEERTEKLELEVHNCVSITPFNNLANRIEKLEKQDEFNTGMLPNIIHRINNLENQNYCFDQIFDNIWEKLEDLDKTNFTASEEFRKINLILDAHSLRFKELEESKSIHDKAIQVLSNCAHEHKKPCINVPGFDDSSEIEKTICDYCKNTAVYSAIPVSNEYGEYFKAGNQIKCPKCDGFYPDNLQFISDLQVKELT